MPVRAAAIERFAAPQAPTDRRARRRPATRPPRSTRRSRASPRSEATRRGLLRRGAGARAHPVMRWSYPRDGRRCAAMSAETRTVRSKSGAEQGGPGSRTWSCPSADGSRSARARSTVHYHFLDAGNGTADAARPADRRPGEGFGDEGPRRLPAVLRGLARQPVPDHRDGSVGRPPCSGRSNADTSRAAPAVERRLGRRGAGPGGLPLRGRREQLVLRRAAHRGYDDDRQGHGRPHDRRHDPGLGRTAARRHRGPGGLDRELGRLPRRRRVLRELGRPGPGMGHLRHAGRRRRSTTRCSASGPATTPTRPS